MTQRRIKFTRKWSESDPKVIQSDPEMTEHDQDDPKVTPNDTKVTLIIKSESTPGGLFGMGAY